MQPATLRRNADRALYDVETAQAVFRDSYFANVAYTEDGFPQCVPMIALFEKVDDESEAAIYLHGYPTSRLPELVKAQHEAEHRWRQEQVGLEGQPLSEEGEGSEEANGMTKGQGQCPEKLKVCINAAKVDGLVLSSAPNGHAFNYRSATAHGTCTLITSPALKRHIMHLVTNHIMPLRWEAVNPVSTPRVNLVTVIKVSIDKLSTKIRTGRPGIQTRYPEIDGPDREGGKVWTGTVPVWESLGEPIESGLTPGAELGLDGVREYIERRNGKMERRAREACVRMEFNPKKAQQD